ncbi:MAG: tetratricopeptide repeat protein [Coriobacteriales bacterium]|jgi:tetratricopeptide (TPR) repeat protein|nr:tetratricopeptide repeat protein [Coriobacteriales bacterium]
MPEDWLRELDALLSSGQPEAAERFLLDRLTVLEEQGESESAFFLSLLNELASLYRGISRYQESEQAFVRLQKTLQAKGQTHTLPYAVVLINIAGCYRLTGDALRALEHYGAAQAVLASLTDSTNISPEEQQRARYLTASVLNNISLLYCDTGQFELALSHAERAAKLIRAGVGDEHELATTYNNLASIYLKLGRMAEAEEACGNALALYQRMPRENVHHAAALATFAALRFEQGDYPAAEAALQEALVLTEHFFGRNAEYAVAERNLAQVREALAQTRRTAQDQKNGG